MAYSDKPLIVTNDFPMTAARELAADMRSSDIEEIAAQGHTVEQALNVVLDIVQGTPSAPAGKVWAVYSPRKDFRCRGVFGYTRPPFHMLNAVGFSLWAPLSFRESRQVIRETKKWTLKVLAEARVLHLFNTISAANRPALGWLKLSGCFDVLEDVTISGANGECLYPFKTKPVHKLRELPH